MTRQEIINKAVAWATGIAEDNKHGYDQANRWGADYDCSSFVISAWEYAGVPVKTGGASYTGNMYFVFLKCGFADVTNEVNLSTGSGLEKGDVLLNKKSHTELYIGNGKVVKASINEKGGTTGGKTGDQTGREIYIGSYYNYPWDCVLRYKGNEEKKADPVTFPCYVKLPELKRGDGMGDREYLRPYVKALQILLRGLGFDVGVWGADGQFGAMTEQGLMDFQRNKSIEADGVAGNETYSKLFGG